MLEEKLFVLFYRYTVNNIMRIEKFPIYAIDRPYAKTFAYQWLKDKPEYTYMVVLEYPNGLVRDNEYYPKSKLVV